MKIVTELFKSILGGPSIPTPTAPKPMPDETDPEMMAQSRRRRAQQTMGGRQSTILDGGSGDYSRETMGGK